MRVIFAVVLWLAASSALFAQSLTHSDLAGFTKSPTEHIIDFIDEPLNVTSVRGVVESAAGNEPLEGVVFEIKGAGASTKVRRSVTNGEGAFVLRHVPAGRYKFKATLNGFQSVVGTIVVDPRGGGSSRLQIRMKLGV